MQICSKKNPKQRGVNSEIIPTFAADFNQLY